MNIKILTLFIVLSGLLVGCQKNRVSDPVGLTDIKKNDIEINSTETNNNWKKVTEADINQQDYYTVRFGNPVVGGSVIGDIYKIYKVLFHGSLSASGTGSATDRKILIELNGSSSGYYSQASAVVSSDGRLFTESDTRGFYVGRNGWSKDMNLSFEYTISVKIEEAATTGFGQATFSNSSGDLLEYRSDGNWGGTVNIFLLGIRVVPEAIGLEGTPGNLTGKLIIYAQ